MSSTEDNAKHKREVNGTDDTSTITTTEHEETHTARRNSSESTATQSDMMRKLSSYVGAHTDAFTGSRTLLYAYPHTSSLAFEEPTLPSDNDKPRERVLRSVYAFGIIRNIRSLFLCCFAHFFARKLGTFASRGRF